jgi:hypothetical protein
MLNPSTATAKQDDATMRRVLRLTQRAGYGALEVVNLFAIRSKDPKVLLVDGDPVGPDNDRAITSALERGRGIDGRSDLVLAWGAYDWPVVQRRQAQVLAAIAGAAVRIWDLGRALDGSPFHPLARRKLALTRRNLEETPCP